MCYFRLSAYVCALTPVPLPACLPQQSARQVAARQSLSPYLPAGHLGERQLPSSQAGSLTAQGGLPSR